MGKKPEQWRNRIIGTAEVPPDQLLANPANWRTHPGPQQNALTDILGDDHGVGWVARVMVNKRTSELWPDGDRGVETVVDGHLRVALAMRHNQPTVPVDYVDLTPAEEALVLATFDPIGALAQANAEQLDAVLREVQTGSEAVGQMLAGLAEDAGLYLDKDKPEDPGAQVDKADELREKWQTELGQLWQLGEHRLICGDCTDKAVVERVMGGEKAQICWTDPPWNVAYGEAVRSSSSDKFLSWKPRSITNDNLGEKFGEFADKFCQTIFDNLVPGGILYMAMSAQEWGLIMGLLEDKGFHWSSTIIWAKDQFVVSRKDYHTQYEPLWYGWRGDAARVCEVEDRTQSDLWLIDRPKVSEEHPTMKPVPLVERSLENSSRQDAVVFEPFAGSGTTLVACERLGRRCRAIELEPKYVAVALERWSVMTGQEPVLLP